MGVPFSDSQSFLRHLQNQQQASSSAAAANPPLLFRLRPEIPEQDNRSSTTASRFSNTKKLLVGDKPTSFSTYVLERCDSIENPSAEHRLERVGLHNWELQILKPPHNSHEEVKYMRVMILRFCSWLRHYMTYAAEGEDELTVTAGEELEIQYQVEGWFYVNRKRPRRDEQTEGLVPVRYLALV